MRTLLLDRRGRRKKINVSAFFFLFFYITSVRALALLFLRGTQGEIPILQAIWVRRHPGRDSHTTNYLGAVPEHLLNFWGGAEWTPRPCMIVMADLETQGHHHHHPQCTSFSLDGHPSKYWAGPTLLNYRSH